MSESHLDNTLVFETTASDVDPGDFVVQEMRGVEGLSTPYEFRLTMACSVDGGLAPETIDELLATTCEIGFGPGGLQRIGGVLSQIELVSLEADGSRALYEAVLVPRLWLASLTRRSRCFNDLSLPDIITTVLEEMGWGDGTDFEFRLTETYAPREYVVQYEETDFAFLSRWMERLGMFYLFEQVEGVDKLVITDANAELVEAPDHGECTYSTHVDEGVVGAVHRIRRRNRRVPMKVHVRDYNWRTPGQGVRGDADVDAEHGYGLQAYSGDHFKDDGEGATAARLRSEGFGARKCVYSAWSVNPDFTPGFRFTLSGSPIGELDLDYLLVRVVHHAQQLGSGAGSGSYRNEFQTIAQEVPYRAPRVTPWPRIDGILHAKIDAEAIDSGAPIDPEGRYKVLFPYDLYGGHGGKATRWVRKAEPYSGPSYGMHFTLHVGAEVAIAHTFGDPDRPVIVGSVPNMATLTPLNKNNATRSAIRTRSGILFDFEDNA